MQEKIDLSDVRIIHGTFCNKLGDEEQSIAKCRAMDNIFQRVICSNRSSTYLVKIGLGGQQHHLGTFDNPIDAMRFADLALLVFWKYKLRGAQYPTDKDCNISLKNAELDFNSEWDMVQKLLLIRAKLIGHQIILEPIAVTDGEPGINHTKALVYSQLSDRVFALEEANKKLESTNRQLVQRIEQLETQNALLAATLTSPETPSYTTSKYVEL